MSNSQKRELSIELDSVYAAIRILHKSFHNMHEKCDDPNTRKLIVQYAGALIPIKNLSDNIAVLVD